MPLTLIQLKCTGLLIRVGDGINTAKRSGKTAAARIIQSDVREIGCGNSMYLRRYLSGDQELREGQLKATRNLLDLDKKADLVNSK